jgi:lysophospholipase-3
MQRSFTSSAFLFPSTNVWGKDEVLAITADRNYTINDVEQFFNDINYTIGYEQYKMANTALRVEPPGVPIHCIFGHDVQTPEQLTWARGYFPDYQPAVLYGDGDGTVNRKSLEVCGRWQKEGNNGSLVTIHRLAGADHLGILADLRTIQLIKDILYNPPQQ